MSRRQYEHPNIPEDKLEGVSFQWLRLQCAQVERAEAMIEQIELLNRNLLKLIDTMQDMGKDRRRR